MDDPRIAPPPDVSVYLAGDWVGPCEAYGADGYEFGAVCFVGDLNRRVCKSAGDCTVAVASARRRTWQRLQELAAEGRPEYVQIAAEFSTPEQLFRGVDTALEPYVSQECHDGFHGGMCAANDDCQCRCH